MHKLPLLDSPAVGRSTGLDELDDELDELDDELDELDDELDDLLLRLGDRLPLRESATYIEGVAMG